MQCHSDFIRVYQEEPYVWTLMSEFSDLILSFWLVSANFDCYSSTDEAGNPSAEACSGEWVWWCLPFNWKKPWTGPFSHGKTFLLMEKGLLCEYYQEYFVFRMTAFSSKQHFLSLVLFSMAVLQSLLVIIKGAFFHYELLSKSSFHL